MPKAKVKDILTYATENKFGVAAINTLNIDRKSTRLNSSHKVQSRMPSSA